MSNSQEETHIVVDLGSSLSIPHEDTRDAKGLEVEDVSYDSTHCEQSQQDDIWLLSTLSFHLDLLTAGSLFLLPSILPFLASTLTSYITDNASPQSIPSPTTTTSPLSYDITSPTSAASDIWNWQTTWVPLLPCIGAVAPLSLLKVMTMVEESSFQCPFQRWRRSKSGSNSQRNPICVSCARDATRVIRQQQYHRHGTMFGPTVHVIKRAWQAFKREPSGYQPLSLDSPLSEGFSDNDNNICGVEEESECDDETIMVESTDGAPCTCKKSYYYMRQQPSVLPRPRSILRAGLIVWTVLMGLSSILGLNTVRPTSAVFNDTNATADGIDLQTWESMSTSTLRQGGFIAVEESRFPSDGAINYDDGEHDILSVVAAMQEQERSPASLEELNQPLPINQHELFATIKTSIIIVNKERPHDASASLPQIKEEEEEENTADDIKDFMEPDSLDALIMDPDDAILFHDFLAQLKAEDQATKAPEESNLEAYSEKQKRVIKATDDHMIPSMLENDIPCGTKTVPMRPTPTIDLPDFVQKILDSAGPGRLGQREGGQTFEYLAGWTELMILAVATCFGTIMAGLAQARVLSSQLSESSEASVTSPQKLEGCASTRTLPSCLAISGSALGLTLLMIFSECWDVPSVYFSGIGIAGIILIDAWIPDMSLQVECVNEEANYYGMDQEKALIA
ncbi:hypothetical protein BGZ79_001258 [Entomortierella chlamydospora]|nr:hypothetical protein BGZ79_001258 [Entomortierella chlamydospora]